MKRLGWVLLLGLFVSGCATTRVVRLEVEDGERVVITPRKEEAAPRLEEDEFKKAGMELKDPENIVEVPGHRSPHPAEYHRRVMRHLLDATEQCRTVVQCRDALTSALKELAEEVSTPGTMLNKLLTTRDGR